MNPGLLVELGHHLREAVTCLAFSGGFSVQEEQCVNNFGESLEAFLADLTKVNNSRERAKGEPTIAIGST